MIALVNEEALRQLRVEEGKVLNIGSSHDPLDGTWTKPSKRFKKQLFIQHVGVFAFILLSLLALSLIMLTVSWTAWVYIIAMMSPILIFTLVFAALTKWVINRIYAKHRFRITDEELVIETGFITTQRVLIPLIGVQQVNVIETFWGKRYGLKNVVVNTAGNVYIPNAATMWGSGVLMGLRNADEVAEALLSRVKKVKAEAKAGI